MGYLTRAEDLKSCLEAGKKPTSGGGGTTSNGSVVDGNCLDDEPFDLQGELAKRVGMEAVKAQVYARMCDLRRQLQILTANDT